MDDEPIATIARATEQPVAEPLPGDDIVILEDPPVSTRAGRGRILLNVAAAAVPALLYLAYVRHYSVNVPFSDDWKKTSFVVTAIHGRVALDAMWRQYAEARLFLPNLVFVWFGLLDHFDLRGIVTLSAASLIASYALLLALFRNYLGRPLTPLAILSVGVVWFSLADSGNALWAFQLAWYFVVLFLVVMLFFLLWRPAPSVLFTGGAIVAAVAGTCSMLQGFVLWPVGVLCLIWTWQRRRAHVIALVAWLVAFLATFAVYVHGYNWSRACVSGQECSLRNVGRHPAHYGRFFASLPGYVVPRFGPFDRAAYDFHLVLGLALLAGSGFVIVQSFRERHVSRRPPLPPALIAFALVFDVTIAIGRGAGRIGGASQSRFTMANIVLVTGLVIYAWARVPSWRSARDRAPLARRAAFVAFGALALFVVAQTIFTTQSGIDEGRAWRRIQVTEARVIVNRREIPAEQVACYFRVFVVNNGSKNAVEALNLWQRYIHEIGREGLYMFEPAAFRAYRRQGAPVVPGVCYLGSATQLVPKHS